MTGITTQKTVIRTADTTDYYTAALETQTEIKELEERLTQLKDDLTYQINKINELGLTSKIARVVGCRTIRKINAAWLREHRPDLYRKYAKVSATNAVSILGTLAGSERAVYDQIRAMARSAFDDAAEIALGDVAKDDFQLIDRGGGVDRITQATKKSWVQLIESPAELEEA